MLSVPQARSRILSLGKIPRYLLVERLCANKIKRTAEKSTAVAAVRDSLYLCRVHSICGRIIGPYASDLLNALAAFRKVKSVKKRPAFPSWRRLHVNPSTWSLWWCEVNQFIFVSKHYCRAGRVPTLMVIVPAKYMCLSMVSADGRPLDKGML